MKEDRWGLWKRGQDTKVDNAGRAAEALSRRLREQLRLGTAGWGCAWGFSDWGCGLGFRAWGSALQGESLQVAHEFLIFSPKGIHVVGIAEGKAERTVPRPWDDL